VVIVVARHRGIDSGLDASRVFQARSSMSRFVGAIGESRSRSSAIFSTNVTIDQRNNRPTP